MPRASGSGKRQQGAAGQRDTRHDNGLVGPAKRASGRKSQGAAGEGSARTAADHGSGHAGSSLPAQAGGANGFPKNPIDGTTLDARHGDAARRSSLGTYSETSSESCNSNLGTNGVMDGSHRHIDVNALKNIDVHRDSGPLDLAITVLKTLPLQDTLAILIILMHLPSLSLSVIYAIFTFLTFVPPVTTSSGMNINLAEIFEGINSMPSLVTVVCMDFFFFMIWLFLWQPMQEIVLDLAKPVIALTLGGGTGQHGSSSGVTACFSWVFLHHMFRSTQAYWSRVVHHIPEKWRPLGIMGDSFDPASHMHLRERKTSYGFIRSILGIHILTQGLVRYIREWYLKREKGSASSGQNDPEAAKSVSGAGVNDASHEAGFNTPDTEAGPTASANSSTNKKKRKQSAQVRLQQPLWAALASTKIVVMKEYELSHASPESLGSNATDIHNLGNAPFDKQPAQIWISYIGSDEVCFNTSHFLDPDCDSASPLKANGHAACPAGVDTTKPFYVRVNNAPWQLTRLFQVQDLEEDSQEGTRWTGDIYGLRPSSKYVCEFVDSRTHKVVFTTNIRTVKEPLRENDGLTAAPPIEQQQSLRPDSPATTLRTSIAAAESRLADERNRLKTWRKEWKSRINSLRKENELADNQLATAGNSDEKYKQKIRQQETQKAQAERDTELISEQLKHFDTAPELGDRKKKTERAYSAEKKIFDAAQKEFKHHKADLDTEVKSKEVEKSNLNTRRNKIATRIAKVENELANIADANNRGLNEAERRNRARVLWQDNVMAIESNYHDRINGVFGNNMAKHEQSGMVQAEIQAIQNILSGGIPMDMGGNLNDNMRQFAQSSPWNPNPIPAPHYPRDLWNDSSIDLLPPLPPSRGPPNNFSSPWKAPAVPYYEAASAKARGRSSSMLSDVSGFTQSSEEAEAAALSRSPIGGMRYAPRGSGRAYRVNGSSGSSGSNGSGSVPVSPA